jgi:hypothetical protein
MTNKQKINVLSALICHCPEDWYEEDTTGNDVLLGAKFMLKQLLEEEYPNKDFSHLHLPKDSNQLLPVKSLFPWLSIEKANEANKEKN